jgi:hypothetical protein
VIVSRRSQYAATWFARLASHRIHLPERLDRIVMEEIAVILRLQCQCWQGCVSRANAADSGVAPHLGSLSLASVQSRGLMILK